MLDQIPMTEPLLLKYVISRQKNIDAKETQVAELADNIDSFINL